MEQWMTDPPFSTADLIRSVADITVTAEKWRKVPDDFLVGIVARENSTHSVYVREGAQAELQRRSHDATRQSTIAHAESAARLEALTVSSGRQTDKVIALTERLRRLTVVITWLTIAAVVFGGIQAGAVLVHFYRWYRGW
jgi:hypothetical protein